jgi:aspartate oxidase
MSAGGTRVMHIIFLHAGAVRGEGAVVVRSAGTEVAGVLQTPVSLDDRDEGDSLGQLHLERQGGPGYLTNQCLSTSITADIHGWVRV